MFSHFPYTALHLKLWWPLRLNAEAVVYLKGHEHDPFITTFISLQ